MINETRSEVKVERCDSFYKCHRKSLSWSAIIAGAIVAFVISFLFNLFGIAIGLTAFTNTQTGVSAFAIGGFIGLIIVAIVSMFVGGMVSGYLGRPYCVKRNLGVLYGALTFGIALFLAVLLTAPIANFLSHNTERLYGSSHAPIAVIANPMSNSSTMISSQDATTRGPALNSTNSSAAAMTEKNANDIGKAGLLTFILFAIGAFSACIGGHCGMKCKCHDGCSCCVEEKTTRTL